MATMYVHRPKQIQGLRHNDSLRCVLLHTYRDLQCSRAMEVRPAARGFTAGGIQSRGITARPRVSPQMVKHSRNGVSPSPPTALFSITPPRLTPKLPPARNPTNTCVRPMLPKNHTA